MTKQEGNRKRRATSTKACDTPSKRAKISTETQLVTFPLLRLPLELRERVYYWCLYCHNCRIDRAAITAYIKGRKSFGLPTIAISHAGLKLEAFRSFVQTNVIEVTGIDPEDSRAWQKWIDSTDINSTFAKSVYIASITTDSDMTLFNSARNFLQSCTNVKQLIINHASIGSLQEDWHSSRTIDTLVDLSHLKRITVLCTEGKGQAAKEENELANEACVSLAMCIKEVIEERESPIIVEMTVTKVALRLLGDLTARKW